MGTQKGKIINTMRYRKLVLILISVIIVMTAFSMMMLTASANDELDEVEYEVVTADGNPLTSKAAIVIDFNTGLVIFEHNADELRVPASMTKMVAVYVVLDAINDNYITLDTVVDISEAASIFSYNREYSNVPLPPESSFTIRDLLDVVIVRSASAATIALGEGLFGSEGALVAKMNEKVEQLGIKAAFYDSWGGSPDNRISARGMAELTRSLIKEHPEVLSFTSQHSVFFDEVEYRSTNPLLTDYKGVDGFKTGFTNPAGWCFTGTALVEGRRIISVTMGSVQGYRFQDSMILLDYGFANFDPVIANHFRITSRPPDLPHFARNPLVPIQMYNIEESQYFDIRYLALLLNEFKTHDLT